MVVQFEKCELKIDQIHKEEFSKESFIEHEIKVIELIQRWLSKEPNFRFKTSGSTGNAKTILIERKKIEYSCESTMDKIDPGRTFSSALLCLNPEMIGGAMVVFRSLVRNLNLHVLKPTSKPLDQLGRKSTFDLTSLVPLQIDQAGPQQLDLFRAILVGGAPLIAPIINSSAKIYETFGMTETVSHFALKEQGLAEYECIGDTLIEEQSDSSLAIKGSLTDHNLLKTNDLIEFISSKKFKWIGRSDFVINSGGIKINPEVVEAKISPFLDRRFFIAALPDEKLGNKAVLIIEGSPYDPALDFSELEKYQKPKGIHFLERFALTSSQKIDRFKTKGLLIKQLKSQ
ncbi:MAG: AMP-binding protein [Cyclobacteriaceae bacterium]